MTPIESRGHLKRMIASLSRAAAVSAAAAILVGAPTLTRASEIPTFAVEPFWPKPLPNNWIIGQVGGITVDWQGHIWVIHRPRSLTDDEKGFVWIGGNAENDNAILKFTLDGKFVGQIGKIAPSKGSSDTTQLGKPAETAIDKDANEIYVADGYGNRRIIVFDAASGAYKRHWGAYGNPPSDEKQPPYDPKAPASQQFANPVHCVKLANDGLVYVCDRINDRIQVFRKDGTFVKEWFYEKNTLGAGAVWDIAIWPDPEQSYLLSADGENNEIRIINRADGTVVGSFGRNGRNAGQFHWVHALAVDAKGNVYTAEVDNGKRIQKFRLTSDALR